MNTKKVIFRPSPLLSRLLLTLGGGAIAVCLLASVTVAHASESASFRLYDTIPNDGSLGGAASETFLLNENGVTWVAKPVTSAHFQIVTAPPVSSSSASSVSSAVSSASSPAASHPSGGHRGKRTPPALHPSAGQRSSSSFSSSPASSSASTAAGSSSASSILLPVAPFTPDVTEPVPCLEPLHPSASCGDHCQCERPWSFGGMCVAVSRSLWSWLGIVCAAIEVLLLLRIFRHRALLCRRSR